ncbi:hypothetical protein FOL47_010682 [Perkinsus chesapeaki]|uniref:Uncharacterized protein n=1 Tax=Perkinsus chesapeaki TaxID=330153 RepID=A0A7J6MQV1_PERCH|nr:hypothetical protein FOL47_010682 [Perkinsus chesapeaki]
MLLPSHVEALRCMMVERLWKDSMSIGPLPELMSDIMAYTPEPTLTLDCPMEEILFAEKPALAFAVGNVLHTISVKGKAITLQARSIPGKEVILAESDDCTVTFYYDRDTSHLFVLYNSGGPTLLDYDVKAGKAHKTYKLPDLFSRPYWPSMMLVIDKHVFVGSEYCIISRSYTKYIDLLHVSLCGDINVIWRSPQPAELIGFHAVSKAPLMVDVVYKMDGKYTSVRLAMTRAACPMVFEERRKNSIAANTELLPGSGLHVATSGTKGYIVNSQLKRMSEDCSLPGRLTYTSCISADHDAFYLVASCTKYTRATSFSNTSYSVLCFYPYIN